MREDELMRPWFDHAVGGVVDTPVFDIHTHTGFNDPDGFKSSAEDVVATLTTAGSRGIVMPMHEPDGYAPANDRVLEESEASRGRLVPFCRLDPHKAPVEEARRCVDSGARGIKLHPRAEGFDLADPAVDEIFAFAHERRLPILIHAGRGIPALALHALMLSKRYPDARVILAHGALTDLSWVWRELPSCPNVFIDSSTWSSSDLTALLALVPPGQVLYGSDIPYFSPHLVATLVVRSALHVGLSSEQLACIMGGQSERLISGEDPIDVGPPPGREHLAVDVLLERVYTLLVMAVGRMVSGDTGYEPLALARLGCELGDAETTEGSAAQHVLALLDRQEHFARAHARACPEIRRRPRSRRLRARGGCRGELACPRARREAHPLAPSTEYHNNARARGQQVERPLTPRLRRATRSPARRPWVRRAGPPRSHRCKRRATPG